MRFPEFRLRGLWNRQYGSAGAGGFASNFPALPAALPGTYNFVPVSSGFYLLVAWGQGGEGGIGGLANAGGGSGAYLEVTRFLAAGSVTVIRPGRCLVAENTTITFPDASVATAGRGGDNAGVTPGAGGVATGGDFMLNGAAGGVSGAAGNAGAGTGGGTGSAALGGVPPRAGAPARLPFRGGSGGNSSNNGQTAPGASGVFPSQGGDGLVLVVKVS